MLLVIVLLGDSLQVGHAATNLSVWVYPAANGRLIRQPDAQGNRILDCSAVGYLGGTVPIPDVAVKTNLAPVAGDNGASIQAAINYVAGLPADSNGFRGAVLLSPGWYPVSNTIVINASGIVLRGAGDGSDTNSNTVLYATYIGTNQPSLLLVSNSTSYATILTRNITNNYVPAGARSFNVDSPAGFSAGTTVFVHRPSPANWIHDLGMDQVSPAWTAGSFDLYSDRTITRIEGNTVMLDEPLTCALDQQYGGATVFSYAWAGRLTNVGIEHLRGISYFNPAVVTNTSASTNYYSDENHAWDFIQFYGAVANGWVRNVTASNFAYSCVHVVSASASKPGVRNITVRDCTSLDPVSIITGERRYAFDLDYSKDVLVQNCYTRNDRHQFVTHALTTGPNVFVDGASDKAWNNCGPHFRWGTGAIWDNVTTGDNLEAENYGNEGTSHGWAGANEVDWNCIATNGFIVQNPPTARNWLIGGTGTLQPDSAAIPTNPPAGTYDSVGTNVFPNSLYYAQLQDRLAVPNQQSREYWLGQIDQFSNSASAGEAVPVDSTWLGTVQTAAGSVPVSGFDIITNNQWVPFTFTFPLAATDQIVGATLSLAMRSYGGTPAGEALFLTSPANSNSFSDLGWLPIGTGTNTTTRVLDLGNRLNLLTNGMLNVAVAGDVGIDWALLELQVAPAQTLYTNFIPAVADAYVWNGTNASLNFGTNTTLQIKTGSASVQRQAFLRWNLAGCAPNFQQARLRLTPVSVGTNGYENGITLVTNNGWGENTINWNNQPVGGKRFATWIPSSNNPVEVVVTPQVQAALAGDGQLSLELLSLNNAGGSGVVSYASREDSNPSRQPQLLLVYTNPITTPQITNFVQGAGGSFTLSGAGPAGQGYRVLVATNPGQPSGSWTATATGTFSGGIFNYTDLQATNYPSRYFRLVSP